MPESLDETAVRHVAQLARLNIADEQIARYAVQLSAIIGYVRQLDELDTSDVPPTAHAAAVANVFRDDTIRPTCSPDEAVANAPARRNTFFKVPKVLDQDSA